MRQAGGPVWSWTGTLLCRARHACKSAAFHVCQPTHHHSFAHIERSIPTSMPRLAQRGGPSPPALPEWLASCYALRCIGWF